MPTAELITTEDAEAKYVHLGEPYSEFEDSPFLPVEVEMELLAAQLSHPYESNADASVCPNEFCLAEVPAGVRVCTCGTEVSE